MNRYSKHLACISPLEKKSKLNPRLPDLGVIQKRRGSHTFAYPEHWPWRAIERDKQRSQPTSGMICSNSHTECAVTESSS